MKQDLAALPGVGSSHPAFDRIRIEVAGPERILSWSTGEIKKPETINYRTFKPERDGLFCARIFGPIKDYECLCGKYKRMKYKGVLCEKCGVEVTTSKVRRERMGHIELAAPVAHIWFLKSLPSRISVILDMPLKDVERVLYFESYIVTEPGVTPLAHQQLLDENQYHDAVDEYGLDSFAAGRGAEAVRELLAALDLDALSAKLREEIKIADTEVKLKKLAKRLKLVESFVEAKILPEWMILTVIPVIPPELRPLVPLDGGRFATSDLNDLYRRVINRNNRLKRLIELHAPDIIIANEKRMLQESVDALFDNGRRGRPISSQSKRPLKSLADMLKGKQGRFRLNLLGKRVDYSGRSVVVVGPTLKLHECGLPKRMALELFKPFIYARLDRMGLSATVKQSRKMVERERPEVWDILDHVIRQHPVLLNRAPTLHRLGIQAFEPILIEGKAIQLHPLVCAAFNADFDGDQMAVHVPLSLEAQLEARVLMMSTNNILHPASGEPIIVPSQDIVLGLYHLSQERKNEPGEGKCFADINEVHHALMLGAVTLHSRIKALRPASERSDEAEARLVETTPGRLMVAELIPDRRNVPFSLCNRLLTKSNVSRLIDAVYRHAGQKETVVFCDRLMRLGFEWAYKSGISIGKDDILIPKKKDNLVSRTRKTIRDYEDQYSDGLITRREKYNKTIDAWSHCGDNIARMMMDEISAVKADDKGREVAVNAIHMMVHSGARGSESQVRQLAGMRGLMSNTSGEVLETPITSNFKEGLSVLEYFISTHGARKGLADTALKTANSGYLTRRLVDVAQDCIVTESDCGTERGLTVAPIVDAGKIAMPLGRRVLGRVLASEVVDPQSGEVLAASGEPIVEALADRLDERKVPSVRVRSVLTCESRHGVCVQCYGRDLARGETVNRGEAVGVIAAQSIGEPGTQLTMRTFHIGGAAQLEKSNSFMDAEQAGRVEYDRSAAVKDSQGRLIGLGRALNVKVKAADGSTTMSRRLIVGSRLLVEDGEKVEQGRRLAEWDPYSRLVLAEVGGTVAFEGLADGISIREEVDESTGITRRVILDWRTNSRASGLHPAIVILDEKGEIARHANGAEARYLLSPEAALSAEAGAVVVPGDELARLPLGGARTRDITGGLPRVSDLFEARRPKDHAVMAEISGRVEFGRDYKNKRQIIIRSEDDDLKDVEYMAPKGRHLLVQEGEWVEKGEVLLDGPAAPHDILAVKGVEALAEYLLNEVQDVYRLQGVVINDKHIEVILRQMMRKVEIEAPGDTRFLLGEQVDHAVFEEVNRKVVAEKGQPAESKPLLLGITRAALQTGSFISAASFQETTKVLTAAAVSGRIDKLDGLKENVIVGRLIPAGTGAEYNRFRQIAEARSESEAPPPIPPAAAPQRPHLVAVAEERFADAVRSDAAAEDAAPME